MFASFDDKVKDEIKRWNTNQISKHNNEMIKLIDKYTNEEKSQVIKVFQSSFKSR
jgi:hypothetical protein